MSITKEYLTTEPVNFAIGLGGVNAVSGIGLNSFTATNDTVNQSKTFQPSLYYEQLKNYPYLRTLVSILRAPINEAIDQINGQIKITSNQKKNNIVTDAVIIVNNFFERCDFKSYLKQHLDDFILRGAYLGYIDYRGGAIVEVIDPYNFLMVNNGKEYTWVIPSDINNTLLQVNQNNLYTGSTVRSLGEFYRGDSTSSGFPAYRFLKYFFDTEVVQKETRRVLTSNVTNTTVTQNLNAILGGKSNIVTAQKLTDDEKSRLDQILVAYTMSRPKSLFEPYLKSLFLLSLKEMVFDLISLLQYLKTDYFTVHIRAGVQKNERVSAIVKNIQAALNKYNLDIIRTYEDPSGILAAVMDKLINRNEVLPIVDEFSSIDLLNIPDIHQRLDVLYNDIEGIKKRIADEVGIAQESISGSSNRWEAISRNEKATLNVMNIKTTVEYFVKSAACNIVYNHMNEHYWLNKLKGDPFPTSFNFSGELSKIDGINSVLTFYSNSPEYKDLQGGSIGVMLNPNVFEFQLNLSVILDSYAAKTKENIIVENIQSTSTLLDNLKGLLQNHADILDKSNVIEYIKSLLKIADYASNIVDDNKLLEFVSQMAEMPPMDPMMQQDPNMDPNAMGGMDPNMQDPMMQGYQFSARKKRGK